MVKRAFSPIAWILPLFWIFYASLLPVFGGEGDTARREDIQELQKALAARPESVDLLWELARRYHEAGNQGNSGEAKLTAYLQCQDYAQKAVQLDDTSAPAHFWLGICYGKEAGVRGMLAGLSLSDKVRNEMTRVIALDPLYGDAGGHRALGRLFFKLPDLFGGDLEKAREHLAEAVRLAPDFSTNHLYLAEVYLRLKEYDLALHHLKVVQEFPDPLGEEERIIEERKKAAVLMRDIPVRIRKKK